MSWLYSRALVEEYSAENSWGGELSAPLNANPTPQAFLPSDRMTAFSRLSRFGMTFAPLTESLGEGLLTWFLEDSRAKISALPEREPELPEREADSGPKWRGLLAKYDPDTRSWKTAQLCLLEDSELSSVIWPRSGMAQDGQCWELPMSERPTAGNESGYWPTPTVNGNYNRKGASAASGDGLATAVKMLPTPTRHNAQEGAFPAEFTRNTPTLATHAGGPLNPTWVEWLMGWPLNWSSLEAMNEHQAQQWEEGSTTFVSGDPMRPLWWDKDPSQAPQGPQPDEQLAGECGDSLRDLPQQNTLPIAEGDLQNLQSTVSTEAIKECDGLRERVSFNSGQDVCSETLVPRVTAGVKARVDRLKAIGNGQVPICAATAFRLLTGDCK